MQKLLYNIKLIYLKKINSTNDFLHKMTIIKNWTIIWTKNQTNGFGVGNNKWYTKKNKNLTFSIGFYPKKIDINNYYILNIIVSNAIHKVLSLYHHDFWIKWPNDIILMNKKICGILIHNKIYNKKIRLSLIGIGINIYKMYFGKLLNASSLEELLGIKVNIESILMDIIYSIQKEYTIYSIYGENNIRYYYLNFLYKKNKISLFKLTNNLVIKGIIINVTYSGKLIIKYNNNKYLYFNKKEIMLYY